MTDFQAEELRNRTQIHFDWMDRIRILFGKTAHSEVDITLDQPQGSAKVTQTVSRAWVEKIMPRRNQGGYAVEARGRAPEGR